ncbi:hypothetical protein C0J52_18808 [Blattella germanica]|nr:hypothetical protein C0J52_18808 [Blattella germanica]
MKPHFFSAVKLTGIIAAYGDPRTLVLHWNTKETDKVNVWMGLMHNAIISPFFLKPTDTGYRYFDMLEYFVKPQIPSE